MMTFPLIDLLVFGDNVRRLRKSRGLSLDEVAAQSGVSRLTIMQLERGKSATRLDTILKIAQVLDFRLTPDPYPSPEDLGCNEADV